MTSPHGNQRTRRACGTGAALMALVLGGCGSGGNPPDAAPVAEQRAGAASESCLKQVEALDLTQADPAVAQAIRAALAAVRGDQAAALTWGRLGMTLLAHDFFEPAADCFAQAASRDAADVRWPYFQALALRTARPQDAAELLKTAVRLGGAAATMPRLRLADVLIDLRQLAAADAVLREALAADATNEQVHLAIARLHLEQERLRECLASIDQAHKLAAERPQGCLLAAEAYRRLGDHEAARRQRERATQLAPPDGSDPLYQQVLELRTGLKERLRKAEILFGHGEVQQSVLLLELAVADYPQAPWARIHLARGLIRLRRLDEAEQQLREALRLAPHAAEAHFRLGVVFQLRNAHAEAVKSFEKAVALQPDLAMAYKNLGVCKYQLQDTAGAEAAFRRAVEVQPDFFEGHVALGTFYVHQNNKSAARAALTAALRLRPDDQEAQRQLRELTAP